MNAKHAQEPSLEASHRDKIASIGEIARRAEAAKAAGKKVVQAHGVFDLLHVGHLRHLEAARRSGSFLVVTLTADKHVNKGPGRPVFTEQLRAEMLAALAFVDAVGINPEPTAESAIKQIRPDIYVKGGEYADSNQDVTGKITDERLAVEAHGGKIVFTFEETYSSSNLLNRHFDLYEPSLRGYLDSLRSGNALERMLAAVEGLKDMKVLIVGEAIIDEYQYVTALGKPSKETMLATQFQSREVFAGGAVAAANHVASFCGKVDLLTCLGAQDSQEDFIRQHLRADVGFDFVTRDDAPTTRKCRFVDIGGSLKKLFEIYSMNDAPLALDVQRRLDGMIAERIQGYDVVIVTDFGHGMLHGSTVKLLAARAPFLALNTQTNSGNHGYNLISKYTRADYICLDGPEARLALHNKYATPNELIRLLPQAIHCERIIVTTGKNGCLAYQKDANGGEPYQVPALTNTIVDTVGAGDAFFAVTAPMVARGVSIADAGFLGNAAGAIKVGIVGHRSFVERAPYIKFLTAMLK
jgi:rfaE bifunctional protein nucleotidyltransferase chain/domain